MDNVLLLSNRASKPLLCNSKMSGVSFFAVSMRGGGSTAQTGAQAKPRRRASVRNSTYSGGSSPSRGTPANTAMIRLNLKSEGRVIFQVAKSRTKIKLVFIVEL